MRARSCQVKKISSVKSKADKYEIRHFCRYLPKGENQICYHVMASLSDNFLAQFIFFLPLVIISSHILKAHTLFCKQHAYKHIYAEIH